MIEEITGSPGYAIVPLSEFELAVLRLMVNQMMSLRALKAFSDVGMADYHSVTHRHLWGNKAERCLPVHGVDFVKTFAFLRAIKEAFGDFRFLSECGEREDVFFRIVRPFKTDDVAELHADDWYHPSDTMNTINCWIPLACEGANGLGVIPDSHKRDWAREKVRSDAMNRDVITITEKTPPLMPLETPPGVVVLLNNKLLHKGLINASNKTRVSASFTLVFE